jgi:hypothetical protein
MPCRLPLIAVLAVLSAPVHAGEPLLGPAIEGYGPTYPIDDRDVPLEDGFVYRAVFDIASYGDEMRSRRQHAACGRRARCVGQEYPE